MTLFPDGYSPKLLPKPIEERSQQPLGTGTITNYSLFFTDGTVDPLSGFPSRPQKIDGVNNGAGGLACHYHWLNSSKKHMISLGSTLSYGISRVIISTYVPPELIEGQ